MLWKAGFATNLKSEGPVDLAEEKFFVPSTKDHGP